MFTVSQDQAAWESLKRFPRRRCAGNTRRTHRHSVGFPPALTTFNEWRKNAATTWR